MVLARDCHFDFSRPGRPPYRGSGTVSPPCFRFRARLATPLSGSWRATFWAPVVARFVGVGPRPLAFSARVFGMSSPLIAGRNPCNPLTTVRRERTLTRVDESQVERTLIACQQALAAEGKPDLRALGFWRAVAAVKRRGDLIERYASRIAAIDRQAFRRGVPL